MVQRAVPAGDENAAPEILVDQTNVPVPTPEAEETGGGKLIRCRHNDRFVISKDLVVDGVYRKYPAKVAKEIIEAAKANGVALAVADPIEKKG